MSKTLILSRAYSVTDVVPALQNYQTSSMQVVGDLEGFRSITIWQSDVGFDGQYLVVSEYADEGSAQTGSERTMESPAMADILAALDAPLDVTEMQLCARSGLALSKVQIGEYMSLSQRVPELGREAEQIEELEGIFAGLAFIDGYLGSQIGKSMGAKNEVVGIVFWSTREAFQASLPAELLYEVKLYRRVG